MPFKRFLSLFLALLMLTSTAFARSENANEDAYNAAVNLLQANKYTEAAEAFFTLGNYSDAPQLAMYCSAVASGESGLYSVAVTNFQSLGAFRDAPLLALYYAGRAYEAAEEYESAQEIYAGMTLYRDVATRLATYPEKILARDYAKADAAEQVNLLETALAGFQALGSYKDSEARVTTVQEKINARDYAAADAAETKGDLDTSLKGFTALGSYKDSAERALAIQNKINDRKAAEEEAARAAAYAAADEAEKKEDFATAYNGFLTLGDYLDSAERALALQEKGTYAQAMRYIMAGKYAQAYPLFVDLAKKAYADSIEKEYVLSITSFANIRDKGNGIAAFQFHYRWGLINTNTNTTVPPYWDSIGQFNEYGLACVSKDNLKGYINTQGEVVIQCEWYDVSDFADGLCTVVKKMPNSHKYTFGLIDTKGNVITDAVWRTLGNSKNSDWNSNWYNSARISAPLVHDGKIKVQDKNGLWGFIDQSGALVGKVEWTEIKGFSEGLAVVCKKNKYGFIDKSGNVIIAPTYSNASSFHEGLAAVAIGEKWQYINPSNEVIIQPLYKQAGNFVDGKADVFLAESGWQIIDKTGSLLYFVNGQAVANYHTAVEYMNAGQYEEAVELFRGLMNYKDSEILLKESTYLQAKALLEAGDYETACEKFSFIEGYKDVDNLLNETNNLHARLLAEEYEQDVVGEIAALSPIISEEQEQLVEPLQNPISLIEPLQNPISQVTPEHHNTNIKVGHYITFGHYPQTGNGTDNTPIQWLVLAVDEAMNKALLLSKYALDAKPYNTKKTPITWEKCTLRKWLNNDFLNNAFSAQEQEAIILTSVDNSKNQSNSSWNTEGGSDTKDKVFLLSYAEVNTFFGIMDDEGNNIKARVAPTSYAKRGGGAQTKPNMLTAEGKAAGWWWLRSPGYYQEFAALVFYDGDCSLTNYSVNNGHGAVRPALWVNLDAVTPLQ